MAVFVDETTLRPGKRPAILRGNNPHVPTASPQTSQVVNTVIKLLDQSRARTHYSSSEHFNRSVRLWEAVTRRAEMEEWLPLCDELWLGLDPLVEALAWLMRHAMYSYEDALGLIYMQLHLGDVRKGQYFTPFAVARMMAEMTLHDAQPPYGPSGPPLSFYEPACGSGIMFLAVMQVLENRFPSVLEQGLVCFVGNDIDPVAVLMTRLNLRLRGYPTDGIFCQNSLTTPLVKAQLRPASRSVPGEQSRDVIPTKCEDLPAAPLDQEVQSPQEQLLFF